MGKISDVWLGMSIPDADSNEGKTLVVKNGEYSAAYGLVVLDFEADGSDYKSTKKAGEILALSKGGAILVMRLVVGEDDIVTELVTEYKLDTGTYTLTTANATGTSTDADDPIVISGS